MSIPPQLIRVKRKRADDESPVAFLKFDDDGAKRHRTGSHWVYQRRDARDAAAARVKEQVALGKVTHKDIKPVIHVHQPDGQAAASSSTSPHPANAAAPSPKGRTLSPRPSSQKLRQERRRFHLSRSALSTSTGSEAPNDGVSRKRSTSPAVFVERGRNKLIHKALRNATQQAQEAQDNAPEPSPQDISQGSSSTASQPKQALKKPRTTKAKPKQQEDRPRHVLPDSVSSPHNRDLDKLAQDMNQWVLDEIGANLQQMEIEQKKPSANARFKPRQPAKKPTEGQPQSLQPPPGQADSAMSDVSEEETEDDDDWVIDEYVRIPAKSMDVDISPTEVGVLVLEEEDDNLFFGNDHDEDDENQEDDEDENAENYYAADYPEDEVDSDDEYNRHAYYYRNTNNSDDEQFDNEDYRSDSDDMVLGGDDDDAATMARIKAYMQRYQER